MQSPNQWERLMLGSGMEFSLLFSYSIFCPFKTRKHFMRVMQYNLSENKKGQRLNTKAINIQESKCNQGGRNGHCVNKGTLHLEEPRHNFCSPNSIYLCTSLICNTTRYYAVVNRGNGSALHKLKILYARNAFNTHNLPNIVAQPNWFLLNIYHFCTTIESKNYKLTIVK